MPEITRTGVLLSVQRALLGEITPGMRAISVRWNNQRICIRVYHDGPWATEDSEDFDAGAVTQVVADFLPPTDIQYEFVRLDDDAPLPQDLHDQEAYVYARATATRSGLDTPGRRCVFRES